MIKPFKLDNLKKVSKHEAELIRALYEYLPATDVRDKFHVAIRKSLMKHLGQDIRYFLSSCDTLAYNEFLASLPSNPVLVVLGLTPAQKKAIIQIDQHIANLVINKLLSGSATMSEIKPLTETEQGVLQYLMMQVMSQIYSSAGAEPRVHFRFEKFAFDPADIRNIAGSRERICVLTIEVSVFDQSGFVKMAFPDPFLEEMLVLGAGAGVSREEKRYFERQLPKWGFVKTSIWGEAGNSLLSPVEIKDLEAGDVVLFDETKIKLRGRNMEGTVLLHFGAAEGGVEAGLIETTPKKVGCKLNNIVK